MHERPSLKQVIPVMFLIFCLALAGVPPASSLALTPAGGAAALAEEALQVQVPQMLPVFRLARPQVSANTAQLLTDNFNNIIPTVVITETSHAGTPFYMAFSSRNGSVLEQYAGNGGFFAFNADLAFEETPANLDYGPYTICNFLQSKKLFPPDTPPSSRECVGQNLNYINKPIFQTTLASPEAQAGFNILKDNATSTTEVIGEIWQVPLAVDVGPYLHEQSIYIPLGGPGGHLSLLLTGYDDRPALDNNLPGLQAIAQPAFNLNKILIGLYPVIMPQAARALAEASLLSALPGAVLDLGEPELIYYVEDPAEVQEAMPPVWYFPDATAIVGEEEINLRGFTVPAVEGFHPEVEITSPENGKFIMPGASVQINASITGGEAPYTYTLQLEDGTVIASGTTAGASLTFPSGPLPEDTRPEETGIFLTLLVEDANGGAGFDTLTLNTASDNLFLPLIGRESGSLVSSMQANLSLEPSAVRTMGVEWIRYYNGYGSNLPGTQPDGTGFYNWLIGQGWQGKFHWKNNDAWEKDWRDCTLGGIDCTSGVDRAEFVYFAGHGSPAKLHFGVVKDSTSFNAANARFQNVRWAGFATCQTLRAGPYVAPGNPPLTNWINSFQGSYMLLGFHSNMADVAFGPRLIQNAIKWPLIPQRSIRQAWSLTALQMNAGTWAYMYARSTTFNPVNMILPTSTSSLPPLQRSTIIEYRWVWGN
jgi:hypothetical protein